MKEQIPKEKYLEKYEIDKDGFVSLGDIARGILGRQTQYISRFIDGTDDSYPNLGESLKFKNVLRDGKATGNYHDYMIHKEDIEDFVTRVNEYYSQG